MTYRECARDHYLDEFAAGTTLDDLHDRCWEVANSDDRPGDIFPDDGARVLRGHPPARGVGRPPAPRTGKGATRGVLWKPADAAPQALVWTAT